MTLFWRFFVEPLLDIVFPPSKEAFLLRSLHAQDIYARAGRSLSDEIPKPHITVAGIHVYSCLPYQHPLVKELLWQIKFRGNKKATEQAAHIIYIKMKKVIESTLEFHSEKTQYEVAHPFSSIVLIPLPSSRQRKKEKGFNQCEKIGIEIEKIIKKENKIKMSYEPNILIKNRETGRQVHHTKNDRLHAVQNSFSIAPQQASSIKGFLENKYVFLFDDVTTTGATLASAQKALRDAGASHIFCFAIAH